MLRWKLLVLELFTIIVYECSASKSKLDCFCSIKTPKFVNVPENVGYNRSKIMIWDIAIGKSNSFPTERLFAATPRAKSLKEVPATLAKVLVSGKGNCYFDAYPSYEFNNIGCDGLTTVYAMKIDECNRLWVVDSGHVELFGEKPRIECGPKLVGFDLEDDSVILISYFPKEYLYCDSIVGTFVVDIRNGQCDKGYVYVTEPFTKRVFVLSLYDALRGKGKWYWYTHRYLFPDPSKAVLRSNNVSFTLIDGILSPSIGKERNGDRNIYLNPTAGLNQYVVKASTLRDKSLAFKTVTSSEDDFEKLPGERDAQIFRSVFSPKGVQYFGQIGYNSITCWSENNPYTRSYMKTFIEDREKLNVIISITTGPKKENLVILSSNILEVFKNVQNPNKVNYRICRLPINDEYCLSDD